MIVQPVPSPRAIPVDDVSPRLDDLLDAVESLGTLSGCAAQHAAHLVIVAGANGPGLIAAGLAAAQKSWELGRVRLFSDYQRYLDG